MVEIPEGSSYPRAEASEDSVVASFAKYGFEVPFTDEELADAKYNVLSSRTERMANEEKRSTRHARVQPARRGAAVDDDRRERRRRGHARIRRLSLGETDATHRRVRAASNIEAYVDAAAYTDLMQMNEFTQAAKLGDAVLRSGLLPEGNLAESFLGVRGGMPIYMSDAGRPSRRDRRSSSRARRTASSPCVIRSHELTTARRQRQDDLQGQRPPRFRRLSTSGLRQNRQLRLARRFTFVFRRGKPHGGRG